VGEITARMLLRGTKTKTRQQVKDQLDKLKARVHMMPSAQGVMVVMEVRRPEFPALLELVADCLKDPAFDAKEFEELRRELLADYQQNQDDPMQVGMRGMGRLLSTFPKGHPYYVPSFPELIAETQAVQLDKLKAFHGKFYGAQNGFVAVAGDFDPKATADALASLLGNWKGGESYVRIPNPYVAVAAQDQSLPIADKPMAFLGAGVGFPLKDDHPDYPALMMADYLLGGGFMAGRVTKRLREKEGFSYGAGTFLGVGGHDDNSALMGYAIYGAANVAKVERAFREELEKAVRDGFTADELRLGREGLLKERENLRAMDEVLVRNFIEQMDLGRTMAFEQQIDDRLNQLTLQEIGTALKKYVDPKKLSVLKVGDFKGPPAPK
jgi:zinc protease